MMFGVKREKGAMMEREAVVSSNIASVGYDEANCILEVEFKNGSVYEYFDVPEHLYREFREAGSLGTFLNSHIRSRYRYQRV
jgi:hypothetical protein